MHVYLVLCNFITCSFARQNRQEMKLAGEPQANESSFQQNPPIYGAKDEFRYCEHDVLMNHEV